MNDDKIYFEPNNEGDGSGSADSTRSLDIDERVTVDLAGFFDDPADDGRPYEDSFAAGGGRQKNTSKNTSRNAAGGSFFGDDRSEEDEDSSYENDRGRYSDETPGQGTAADRRSSGGYSRKKNGAFSFRDLTEKPEFYGAAMLLMGAVLIVIAGAIVAGVLSRDKAEDVIELEPASGSYSESAKTAGDGLYDVLGVYRGFEDYERSVREEIKGGNKTKPPVATADETENTKESPSESTPEPSAEETEEPSVTAEIPGGADVVPSGGGDYYVFDLTGEKAVSRKLAAGDTYTSGVGEDAAGELSVGPDGKDLDYGWLRIQNPYNAPGFDLRELLSSPLVITKNNSVSTPTVMFYYTHTSEGYCLTTDERTIRTTPSLASYLTERNIVGRGIVAADSVKKKGVGTLNLGDKNDEDYNKAYQRSAAVTEYALSRYPTVKLALDLHVNTFEYPAGKRYAPVITADGKTYARVLFVVSQNDEIPVWRENVKLAMLLCEKLNEKVRGITLGISLRNEAKYNAAGCDNSLLVEIGFDGNLVTEADNTAALLGDILGDIYG